MSKTLGHCHSADNCHVSYSESSYQRLNSALVGIYSLFNVQTIYTEKERVQRRIKLGLSDLQVLD